MKLVSIMAALAIGYTACAGAAQNYPDRRAYTINLCPHVEITKFSYANEDRGGRMSDTRFVASYSWKNTSKQPIIAIEMVTLKYDAFDDRLIGSRFTVQGVDSTNWSPLHPGAAASDGTIGFREEGVFTGITYVRRVRLADGTVWHVDDNKLLQELKKVAPGIRNPGSLAPDPKQPTKE